MGTTEIWKSLRSRILSAVAAATWSFAISIIAFSQVTAYSIYPTALVVGIAVLRSTRISCHLTPEGEFLVKNYFRTFSCGDLNDFEMVPARMTVPTPTPGAHMSVLGIRKKGEEKIFPIQVTGYDDIDLRLRIQAAAAERGAIFTRANT